MKVCPMKNNTTRIIRVVTSSWQTRIRAVGWYTMFGRLTLYTVNDGRRTIVAEFDSRSVLAVVDTTAEPGKAPE